MNGESSISLKDIYRFLALSMKYPELSWFTEGYCSNFVAILKDADFKDHAERLAFMLYPHSRVIEELQVDYTRLFINAVPQCPAPPFGSVYLESGRSLWGRTTEKVRDFYREHGFDIADTTVVPDEISIELEFLGVLAGRELHKDEDYFLAEFFRPWFQPFRDIVTVQATHPFYIALMELIDFFTLKEED